jgi:hypothetical protein
LTTGAQAATSPSTPVHLAAAQVAQTLFVAGDVGRLSQIPSGTLNAASNKVLLAAPKGKARKGAPKPGTVSLTVKCAEAGKVKLTGTLIQLIGAKPKHGKQKSKSYKLRPVTGKVKAGRRSR